MVKNSDIQNVGHKYNVPIQQVMVDVHKTTSEFTCKNGFHTNHQ
jgi:hypothetical protein